MASNTVSDSDAHWIDKSKPRRWKKLTYVDLVASRCERAHLTVDGTVAFFDGKILATYLVSTGQFAHPISRRELTRDDALRLDEHCGARAGKPCVTHAFDHQEDYKKKDDPENVVRRNQQEATELLRMLYSAAQERNSNGGDDDGGGRGGRGRGRGGGRGGGGRGGGGARADDEEDDEDDGFGGAETVPLGGAELTSAADFPSLSDAPTSTPLLTWGADSVGPPSSHVVGIRGEESPLPRRRPPAAPPPSSAEAFLRSAAAALPRPRRVAAAAGARRGGLGRGGGEPPPPPAAAPCALSRPTGFGAALGGGGAGRGGARRAGCTRRFRGLGPRRAARRVWLGAADGAPPPPRDFSMEAEAFPSLGGGGGGGGGAWRSGGWAAAAGARASVARAWPRRCWPPL